MGRSGDAGKQLLSGLQGETKGRDVDRERRNRQGSPGGQGVHQSVVMGRGKEPWDRQQGNSQREEGGGRREDGNEGWGMERISGEQELADRRGDKLTVSKDTDMR